MITSKIIDNILLFAEVGFITFFFSSFLIQQDVVFFVVMLIMFFPLYLNLSRRIQERKPKEPEKEIEKNESGTINK